MKHLLISILFFSLFFSSCEKGFDYDCTDCTFFYCEVDGEEYTPNCEGDAIGFGCSAKDVRYYKYGSHNIYIYIKNEKRNENLRISSTNVTQENKEYPLKASESFITTFYDGNKSGNCIKFSIDAESETDRLYITEIDTIDFLVAGTFAFTGYNECGDEVHITNGKFRLNYTY